MTRRRLWVPLTLVTGVLVAAAGIGWSVWGEDLTHRHALVRYDDERGEANRYVDLPDGEAQLAIGSPDDHRIVVQWRDPDGRGWTEPETVWTDEAYVAVDNTVRSAAGTVAIRQEYTDDVRDDNDSGNIAVGIVCRAATEDCTAEASPGYGGEAQVTPDGRTAYLGQDEQGVHLWTAARGIHLAAWSGHPGFVGAVQASDPVLAPDGSLRVVTSRPGTPSCVLGLLVSEPGTADLTPAGRTRTPPPGWLPECRTYLTTFSPNWVEVHSADEPAPEFWFVRDGEDWTTTGEDPSGLVTLDRGDACCDTSVAGFIHGHDVAYGSADGRRIRVQVHRLGEETWTRPLTLGRAPKGYTCTWQEGYEVGDQGYVVLMTCHSGKVRDEFQGDGYLVAATGDLTAWDAVFVRDVEDSPEVTEDAVQVGDTTWSPDGGFDRR